MQTCFSLPSVLLTTATEPRWLVMHDTMLVVTQDLVIRAPSKLHPSGSNSSDRCNPSWYQHNTSNMIRGHSLWKPTTIQTSLVIYILHEPMLFMSVYWHTGFNANYCFTQTLPFIMCCLICTPGIHILQCCTPKNFFFSHSHITCYVIMFHSLCCNLIL